MATLTTNLFYGQGERSHRLRVIDGSWPTDMDGSVVVVGPDKRSPGGHWFGAHGLLQRIHLVPSHDGEITVEHKRVNSTINRVRNRLPWLFRRVAFAEASPFGITNLANTGVISIEDRLVLGYDAGRPVEVDSETLEFVSPIGANDEWLQDVPGLLEPLIAVAAHPAVDVDGSALYFVNYSQVSIPGEVTETHLARWDLHGPIRRWLIEGMSPFDSIHDVKVSENHVVISDLPFQIEPGAMRGEPRQLRNQDHTKLWIVAKADLESTPEGGSVPATEVRVPMPTGHLWVDSDEVDGRLRIVLQQIPLADLMISVTPGARNHRQGAELDPAYEGWIAQAVQPSAITCVLIDPATGVVKESDTLADPERLWGGILATTDVSRPSARGHLSQLWYAGVGFDPDLVPEDWWRLYHTATDGLVAPSDFPDEPVPGTLARFDLDRMAIAESWDYPAGSFPSPPTFVPRSGSAEPDDGYIVCVVHQDGPKELHVFEADNIAAGPVARASSPTFNPNLMLHSCWSPPRRGPRPSNYAVSTSRDLVGALKGIPSTAKRIMSMGRRMSELQRAETAAATADPGEKSA